jgi:hypothetical protein
MKRSQAGAWERGGKELILFQSVLSPQGLKYTPLKVIPLG